MFAPAADRVVRRAVVVGVLLLASLAVSTAPAGATCATPQDGRYLGTWALGSFQGAVGIVLDFSGGAVSGNLDLVTGTSAVVAGTPMSGTLNGCTIDLTGGGITATATLTDPGREMVGSFVYGGASGTWRAGLVTETATASGTHIQTLGGSAANPVATSVTSPVFGDLQIDEAVSTGGSSDGYSLFGTVVRIVAPAASSASPLQLTFTIDPSQTGGLAAGDVAVFRNGVLVADCTGAPQAIPDPCVASRIGGGAQPIELTVLTSQASIWTFGASPDATPPDTTPPVITPTVSGTLGANGWYVSDVTVTWVVSDDDSAITSTTGCGPVVLTIDTSGTTLTCSATSAGGTSSASVTIERDATAPSLSPTVSPSPVLLDGTATATAGASDLTSGVAVSSCDPVDTSSVGVRTINCTATDAAGNTSTAAADVSVVYGFTGFFAPVDNGDVRNWVRAGRAVPLKWRLFDAHGDPVTDLTEAAIRATSLACDTGTTVDLVEETTPGGSDLQHLGDGYYQLNWKTPTSYAVSCKALSLDLGEGPAASHTAIFELKG